MNGISDLRGKAREYDLEDLEIAEKYSDAELEVIYNGIGADWMPQNLRTMLDGIYSLYAPAALIHDVQWHEGDGTEERFHFTNQCFRRNMKKILDIVYPFEKLWLWGSRAKWYCRMQEAYTICDSFGYGSWCRPCECEICRNEAMGGEAC